VSLQLVVPFGKKATAKNLVFTILTKEYPLRQIALYNLIKKRYGKNITYQAVRKAVLELTEENVLEEKEKAYQINFEWVRTSKELLETLQKDLRAGPKKATEESLAGDVTVYEFSSLNELFQFWQELVKDWFKELKQGPKVHNCYQGAHLCEVLLHQHGEREAFRRLKEKNVKSVGVITGNAPLDHATKNFYKSIGIDVYIRPSASTFDRGYYVATYGDLIVSYTLPKHFVDAIDRFFHKNRSVETLNLEELSRIVDKKATVKFTVIKNAEMAKHINQSILAQIE
jgi:hypothetical protein